MRAPDLTTNTHSSALQNAPMADGPVGRGQVIRVASIVLGSLEPCAVAGEMIVRGPALPVAACLVFSSSHTPPDVDINMEDATVE